MKPFAILLMIFVFMSINAVAQTEQLSLPDHAQLEKMIARFAPTPLARSTLQNCRRATGGSSEDDRGCPTAQRCFSEATLEGQYGFIRGAAERYEPVGHRPGSTISG